MALKELYLPIRFERLKERAEQVNADLGRIISPIESGMKHIQECFQEIGQSGVSKFEVFYGKSGAGKTTFLETLNRFFTNVAVLGLGKELSFEDTVKAIADFDATSKQAKNVIYLRDRDTPVDPDDVLLGFFDQLRLLFRKSKTHLLVVWPIPLEEKAHRLFELAKKIGADSLIGSAAKPYFFEGPPPEAYYKIADDTAKLFNDGYGLPEFGIDKDLGSGLFAQADTIATYFQVLVRHSNALNNIVAEKLVKKPRPRVWVVLAGDEATELNTTVRTLTFGLQRQLDIASLMPALADEDASTQYLKDWKRLASIAPYLLQSLDLRVIEVPPNVVLAVVRAFGSDEARADLVQKTEKSDRALELLRDSILGELLRDSKPAQRPVPQKTKDDTRAEYVRIQRLSQTKDTLLNHAFGNAIEVLLKQEGALVKGVGKKTPLFGELRPDVHVSYAAYDPVCLEFTWRTTGFDIKTNTIEGQSTLKPGHIRKYLLAKAYDYIKALGWDEISPNDLKE